MFNAHDDEYSREIKIEFFKRAQSFYTARLPNALKQVANDIMSWLGDKIFIYNYDSTKYKPAALSMVDGKIYIHARESECSGGSKYPSLSALTFEAHEITFIKNQLDYDSKVRADIIKAADIARKAKNDMKASEELRSAAIRSTFFKVKGEDSIRICGWVDVKDDTTRIGDSSTSHDINDVVFVKPEVNKELTDKLRLDISNIVATNNSYYFALKDARNGYVGKLVVYNKIRCIIVAVNDDGTLNLATSECGTQNMVDSYDIYNNVDINYVSMV